MALMWDPSVEAAKVFQHNCRTDDRAAGTLQASREDFEMTALVAQKSHWTEEVVPLLMCRASISCLSEPFEARQTSAEHTHHQCGQTRSQLFLVVFT